MQQSEKGFLKNLIYLSKSKSIGIASKMAISFILWYSCLSTYSPINTVTPISKSGSALAAVTDSYHLSLCYRILLLLLILPTVEKKQKMDQ